jgi:uncharacterized membrane protein SpoIIM required for sporulation
MVLESLSNAWRAEHRPYMLFLWGVLYAVVGGLLAVWLFPGSMESVVMVALTAGAATPLMYNTIRHEEAKDLQIASEQRLLREHAKAIMVFMMLFLGITIGMTLLYLVLPGSQAASLFSSQINTFTSINPGAQVTGWASASVTGQVTGEATGGGERFKRIFLNNLGVLFFCIIFSLLYGAGAIFVLTWNASVIALAMGNLIRLNLAEAATSSGVVGIGTYLGAINYSFWRYFIHGFFEIAAYIIAALAGGIISVAIIKNHFRGAKLDRIVLDVTDLLIASFVVLLLAAVIESWITPVLFRT